jgi:hypothetical protein
MSTSAARLREITPSRVRRALKRRLPFPGSYTSRAQWLRAVMWADSRRTFEQLDPESLKAVEVSGKEWCFLPSGSSSTLDFPDFDLCSPPDPLPGPFDIVICEQILEHVVDPLTAVKRCDGYASRRGTSSSRLRS